MKLLESMRAGMGSLWAQLMPAAQADQMMVAAAKL